MKTSIKTLPDSKIEILIEISAEDFINRYCKRAISDLGKNVEIKGFRPGHIPPEILEKEIGQEKILNQAAQEAIKEKYTQAVIDNNLEVIERPEIEILELPRPTSPLAQSKAGGAPKNPLVFKAKTTVLPEVELPDYKKIAPSVKKKKILIKEEEIEETIKQLQSSRAKLIALNRKAQKGDFVEIEYWSPQVEKGKKKKDAFILGKGYFIPGFEEKLEGMKAGEEKEEFSLTMPKNHFMKDLAGEEVKFKLKMISVFKMELPKVNDRFAKSLGDFQDLASLKQNIREGLKTEKEREAKERLRQEILEKIINSVNWNIPEILIEAERERIFNNFKQSFTRNPQISFQDYLNKAKKSEEEIKKSFSEPAQRNIKTFLILREISKKEKIEASDEEVNQEINKFLKNHPDFKKAQKELDLESLKQYTKERIINERVFQLLERLSEEA